MRDLVWTEHPDSRQATKNDLLDIARALGFEARPDTYVPALRNIIRARLTLLAQESTTNANQAAKTAR